MDVAPWSVIKAIVVDRRQTIAAQGALPRTCALCFHASEKGSFDRHQPRSASAPLHRARNSRRWTCVTGSASRESDNRSAIRLDLDELSRLVSPGRGQTLPCHARRVAARDMGLGAVNFVPHQCRTELRKIIERYARKEMMLEVIVDIVRGEEPSLPEIGDDGPRAAELFVIVHAAEMLGDAADIDEQKEQRHIRHHPVQQKTFPDAEQRYEHSGTEIISQTRHLIANRLL